MASSSGGVLKDLVHPSLNEALKTQNSVTFKLVKTGKLFVSSMFNDRHSYQKKKQLFKLHIVSIKQ